MAAKKNAVSIVSVTNLALCTVAFWLVRFWEYAAEGVCGEVRPGGRGAGMMFVVCLKTCYGEKETLTSTMIWIRNLYSH